MFFHTIFRKKDILIIFLIENAVEPVYNDHPRDTKIVAVVGRWSLFRVHICNKSSEWDHKLMVVIDRWSLFGGGC